MSGVPRPYPGDVAPDAADSPFWAGCREGRFQIMRCGGCGLAVWPAGACPRHGAAAMAWTDASGRGTLVTWTVVHQRYATSFEGAPPNVALVELEEGPQVHATVVGTDRPEIGMRLEVAFEDIAPDVTLPVFRPARDAPRANLAG